MTQSRLTFLIDGFNLYHSLVYASELMGGAQTKWLNVHSLCNSYLPSFGGQFGEIYYFSALALHRRGASVQRHQVIIDCLADRGVRIELSRFKPKDVWCKRCTRPFIKYEEKETDVAIGVKLIELFHLGLCDSVAIISGDSDLVPAIETSKRLFPRNPVYCIFPFGTKTQELKALADKAIKIKKERYIQHQFPDQVRLSDGTFRQKPENW